MDEITSIPNLLNGQLANISRLARALDVTRNTIASYKDDYECKKHVVYYGILMTKTKGKVGK